LEHLCAAHAGIRAHVRANTSAQLLPPKPNALLNTKDSGDSGYQQKLKDSTAKELTEIDAGHAKNKQAVVELLIHHVTTVKLEVEEALKQAILTKHAAGEL